MELANRKVTYRLYPTPSQESRMREVKELHRQLYNAALQERIDAYKKGVSITKGNQEKSLTIIRAEHEEYRALNAQSCQVTLKRLDDAYKHFFRRVGLISSSSVWSDTRGQTPGFPRFKSSNRFRGWGYKKHCDGFKLESGDKMSHGRLRLSGIGLIRMRGKAKTIGVPKTCEIVHKNGKWYASVTVACIPNRKSGDKACGLDWGVEKILTVANHDGTSTVIENPRHTRNVSCKLREAQREMSKKKRFSANWNRARKKVSKIHQKLANSRKDYIHQLTASLVTMYCFFSTEKLQVKNMTASAKGTVTKPGKRVRQKSGLNREILSTSPALLFQTLKYKAEEAGCEWVEIDTRRVKPSQTCCCCGGQEKKLLSERVHVCKLCNAELDRDENAAKVILSFALFDNATGLEQSRCGGGALVFPRKHESPTIPLG
jgi:putative transposase